MQIDWPQTASGMPVQPPIKNRMVGFTTRFKTILGCAEKPNVLCATEPTTK